MRAILQMRELPASGCQFSSSHSCTIQRRVQEWDGAISEDGSVEAPDVEVSPQSGFGLCAQGLDLEASEHEVLAWQDGDEVLAHPRAVWVVCLGMRAKARPGLYVHLVLVLFAGVTTTMVRPMRRKVRSLRFPRAGGCRVGCGVMARWFAGARTLLVGPMRRRARSRRFLPVGGFGVGCGVMVQWFAGVRGMWL